MTFPHSQPVTGTIAIATDQAVSTTALGITRATAVGVRSADITLEADLDVSACAVALCNARATGVSDSRILGEFETLGDNAVSITASAYSISGALAIGVDRSELRLRSGTDGLVIRAQVGCSGQAIAVRDSIIGLGTEGDVLRLEATGGRDPLSGQRLEVFGRAGDDVVTGGVFEDLFLRLGAGDDRVTLGNVRSTGTWRASNGLAPLVAGDQGVDRLEFTGISPADWRRDAEAFTDQAGPGILYSGTIFRGWESIVCQGVEVL